MFYARLSVEQFGVWEDRTVWRHIAPMPWSVWNSFIKAENPVGFYTDFASAPRHFRMYENYGGRCNAPADGHDLLYRKDAKIFVDLDKWPDNVEFPDEAEEWFRRLPDTGWYQNFPKELADYIFRQLMIEDDEPKNIYKPMYLAVKVAGESSFHRFKVADPLPCERIYKIGELV